MKRKFSTLIVAAVLFGLLVAASGGAAPSSGALDERTHCTVMGLGKDATVDGSVLNAQTWDISNSGNDVNLIFNTAADHKPGDMRTVECWDIYDDPGDNPQLGGKTIQIPEVPHTYAVIEAEIGVMNEHQVSIMASTSPGREELNMFTTPTFHWAENEPYGSKTHSDAVLGISEAYEITLERSKTAREAVSVLTSLYEKYGFFTAWGGTGECAMIADPEEIWVLDVRPVGPKWRYGSGEPGALWVAFRVPDDAFIVIPNQTPVGEIDLSDPNKMLASSNVFSFAEKRGWWDSKSGVKLRWDEIYGGGRPKGGRLYSALNKVAPSQYFKPQAPEYPIYVKPDKKMSVLDLREVYVTRYEGTVSDQRNWIAAGPYNNPFWPKGTPGKLKGIPSQSTRRLDIAQSRYWLPDPIGGVVWHGFGNPVTNILSPIYAGVTDLPKAYTIGNLNFYNPESAFWICDLVEVLTMTCYEPIVQQVRQAQVYLEGRAYAEQKGIDFNAYELYRHDEAAASKYMTEYSKRMADEMLGEWKALFGRLIVDYDQMPEGSPTVPQPTNKAWVDAVKAELESKKWPKW